VYAKIVDANIVDTKLTPLNPSSAHPQSPDQPSPEQIDVPQGALPDKAHRTRMSSDQRRAAIVEAAVRLFAQDGFRGTTTRKLAQAVGVTEPVLYMHFGTKRDLYSAILEHMAEGEIPPRFEPELTGLMEARDDRSFFTALATAMLKWHTDDPARIRILLYSALEGHELSELFRDRYILPFHRALSVYIETRIAEGAFRELNALQSARAFCAMIANYAMSLVLFGRSEDLAQRAESISQMVEIFLNGVKQPA
jgi:AcrR family transcriptional regulator